MAGLLSRFKTVFSKYPLTSNCLIYGALYASAEFSQQTLLRKVLPEKKEDYDLPLVSRYGILGSTVIPGILFYWYRYLDKMLIGTAAATVVKKVVVDQIVSAPIVLTVFYTGMSALEGKSDLLAEWKEKIIPSYKSSCMFWMPAQAINFMFFPAHLRVVYIGTCSFIWINILCVLKRDNKREDVKED